MRVPDGTPLTEPGTSDPAEARQAPFERVDCRGRATGDRCLTGSGPPRRRRPRRKTCVPWFRVKTEQARVCTGLGRGDLTWRVSVGGRAAIGGREIVHRCRLCSCTGSEACWPRPARARRKTLGFVPPSRKFSELLR